MKTNYHTHCHYCDGKEPPENYVKSALSKGFKALGFSSHAPLAFENDWTLSKADLPKYIQDINTLKNKYADQIEIYLGLEVDFVSGLMGPRDELFVNAGFDYLIGSVHALKCQSAYLSVDGPDEEFRELLNTGYNGNIRPLVSDYYGAIREMVKTGGFQILGHFDLLKKLNKKLQFLDESQLWYKEEAVKTLDCLAESKIIMEINSGGIARGATDELYPSAWILKQAVQRNIPIMINADAHHPDHIDFYFDEALSLLRECGGKTKMVLVQGKWQEVEI